MINDPLLSVHNLSVDFRRRGGFDRIVDDVSFEVYPNTILGIVGESGSGKSITMRAMLGLLPPRFGRTTGEAWLGEHDLLNMSDASMRRLRGAEIGMIFQDPMTALDPLMTVGKQVGEAIQTHRRLHGRELRAEIIRLLDLVGIASPDLRAKQYPHEFSGGMRQRVLIAMALANDPSLIIADEPTTALDVTIQAQIIEVLRDIQKKTGIAIVLITHDMNMVASLADNVVVMYSGSIAESGNVFDIFRQARHPYTVGLLASRPGQERANARLNTIPGQPPAAPSHEPGCSFLPRCWQSKGRPLCRATTPMLFQLSELDHRAACHFHEEVTRQAFDSAVEIA